MPTPSPLSLLQGLLNPNFRSLPVPPAWLRDEGLRRLLALVNHVLGQEPEALRRLARQQGRVVTLAWRDLPTVLRVTPAGLLEIAPPGSPADLTLELTAESLLVLARQALRGDKPAVRIDGDVQLAAEVNWLADHVRWDIEEDLARLIGDVPAHQLAEAGRFARKALVGFVGAAPLGGSPRTPS